MDKREDKIKLWLQKITWLENIIQTFMNMDEYYLTRTDRVVRDYLSLVKLFKGKLQHNKLITKSDMYQCNGILEDMKRKYRFDIDWKGDIIDCIKYTEFLLSKDK